jgi:hypothetical protein
MFGPFEDVDTVPWFFLAYLAAFAAGVLLCTFPSLLAKVYWVKYTESGKEYLAKKRQSNETGRLLEEPNPFESNEPPMPHTPPQLTPREPESPRVMQGELCPLCQTVLLLWTNRATDENHGWSCHNDAILTPRETTPSRRCIGVVSAGGIQPWGSHRWFCEGCRVSYCQPCGSVLHEVIEEGNVRAPTEMQVDQGFSPQQMINDAPGPPEAPNAMRAGLNNVGFMEWMPTIANALMGQNNQAAGNSAWSAQTAALAQRFTAGHDSDANPNLEGGAVVRDMRPNDPDLTPDLEASDAWETFDVVRPTGNQVMV